MKKTRISLLIKSEISHLNFKSSIVKAYATVLKDAYAHEHTSLKARFQPISFLLNT